MLVQVQKFNGDPIGLQFPPHVELTVTSTEPGVRGDTASGGVTKAATLETGLEIRVPALHQGRGEGEGPHRDARVRGPGVGATPFLKADSSTDISPGVAGRPAGARDRILSGRQNFNFSFRLAVGPAGAIAGRL